MSSTEPQTYRGELLVALSSVFQNECLWPFEDSDRSGKYDQSISAWFTSENPMTTEQSWLSCLAAVCPMEIKEDVALELSPRSANEFDIFVASSRKLEQEQVESYLKSVCAASDVPRLRPLVLAHVARRVKTLLDNSKADLQILLRSYENETNFQILPLMEQDSLSVNDVEDLFGLLEIISGYRDHSKVPVTYASIDALLQCFSQTNIGIKGLVNNRFSELSSCEISVTTIPNLSSMISNPGSVDDWAKLTTRTLPGASNRNFPKAVAWIAKYHIPGNCEYMVHPVLALYTVRSQNSSRDKNWFIATDKVVCRACADFLDACNAYEAEHGRKFFVFFQRCRKIQKFTFPWVAPSEYKAPTEKAEAIGKLFYDLVDDSSRGHYTKIAKEAYEIARREIDEQDAIRACVDDSDAVFPGDEESDDEEDTGDENS